MQTTPAEICPGCSEVGPHVTAVHKWDKESAIVSIEEQVKELWRVRVNII